LENKNKKNLRVKFYSVMTLIIPFNVIRNYVYIF